MAMPESVQPLGVSLVGLGWHGYEITETLGGARAHRVADGAD